MSIDRGTLKMAESFFHESKAKYSEQLAAALSQDELLAAESMLSSRLEALLIHVFAMIESEVKPISKVI